MVGGARDHRVQEGSEVIHAVLGDSGALGDWGHQGKAKVNYPVSISIFCVIGVQREDWRQDPVVLGGDTAYNEVDRGHVTDEGSGLDHVIAVETGPIHVIVDGTDRGRGGEGIATPMIGRRKNHPSLRTSKGKFINDLLHLGLYAFMMGAKKYKNCCQSLAHNISLPWDFYIITIGFRR